MKYSATLLALAGSALAADLPAITMKVSILSTDLH